MNFIERNFHQGNNRLLGFGENIHQLPDAGGLGIDKVIGQHDSKGLVPDQVASAKHRVTQAQRFLLPN